MVKNANFSLFFLLPRPMANYDVRGTHSLALPASNALPDVRGIGDPVKHLVHARGTDGLAISGTHAKIKIYLDPFLIIMLPFLPSRHR